MKIKYAIVIVKIREPYSKTLEKTFAIKEGKGYINQGYRWGQYLLADFIEKNFKNPSPKDFKRVLENSEIHVKRFK